MDKLLELLQDLVNEDPSGYTTAFTHPDPLDPNDGVRQRTQARAGDYPYDMPTSYGKELGQDSSGASYQMGGYNGPLVPMNKDADDETPKDPWNLAQESIEEMLSGGDEDTYEPGPQANDAARLGYGNHGRLGDGVDPFQLDLDALRNDFRQSFTDTLPQAQKLGRKGLFALLVQLDPDYSAELFAPDEDSEMMDTYTGWGRHVYAPGAEFDSGTQYEEEEE